MITSDGARDDVVKCLRHEFARWRCRCNNLSM